MSRLFRFSGTYANSDKLSPARVSPKRAAFQRRDNVSCSPGRYGVRARVFLGLCRFVRGISLPRHTRTFSERQADAVRAWFVTTGYRVDHEQSARLGGDMVWSVVSPEGSVREQASLEALWAREREIQGHECYQRHVLASVRRSFAKADAVRREAISSWCREGMSSGARDGAFPWWARRWGLYPPAGQLSLWWILRMAQPTLDRPATTEELATKLVEWMERVEPEETRRQLAKHLAPGTLKPSRARI